MHYRFAMAAWAFACAAVLPCTHAADWTSFNVGKVTGFSTAHTHLPDGRFLLGSSGSLYIQKTFGSSTKTAIPGGSITFDPSCITVKDASTALLGAGGFGSSSTVHLFNPSQPTQAVQASLATVFNYAAAWWQHPTSGRSGWIIAGTNGSTYTGAFGPSQKHNLTFVSADGTKVGSLTGDLSTYSGGMAIDAAGNVYAALYEVDGAPDIAEADKVLKFTADQIDAAVAGVITNTPAPVAKTSGVLVHQFSSAGYIAVDSLNRVWATGFKISTLECYDPASGLTHGFKPDHAPIAGASGPIGYQVQTFTRNGVGYVSYLATDQYTATDTAIMYGYRATASMQVRDVAFSTASQTVAESAGTITATITMTPAPTLKTTVPIALSGTATNKSDYSIASTSIVFNPGDTSKNVSITILDDALDELNDNETLVLKLGSVSPAGHAYVVAANDTHTITITDNDVKPQMGTQAFVTGRVGANYNYQVVVSPNALPNVFTATGLPPGMIIDRNNGVISGRPSAAGDYDQVVITVTNSAGSVTSTVQFFHVDDFAAGALGSFVALSERTGTATGGLGARLAFKTTRNANFTGSLTIGGTTVPVSGSLDTSGTNPSGQCNARVGTVNLVVNFTINAATGAVSGTLDDGGVTKPGLTGWRTITNTLLTGVHNFLAAVPGGPSVSVPQGTSYGSITVLESGVATIAVRAADGSVLTGSTNLGAGGEIAVYQKWYTNPGTFMGSLSMANDVPHTLTGSLTWSKPSQTTPTTQPYKSGWSPVLALTVRGGKYRAPAGTTAALGMTEATGYEATLAFQDGGLAAASAPSSLPVLLPPGKPIVIDVPHQLKMVTSTGAFSGILMGTGTPHMVNGQLVANGIPVAYQGLIIPDTTTPDPFDGSGEGYFLYDSLSGAVSLTAAP